MYKYLLFDADNTLLDFDLAEACALEETLSASPLGFTEEIHKRYHILNDIEWKKLERGETTREKLRIDRFANLYNELSPFTFSGSISRAGFSATSIRPSSSHS